MYNRKISAVDVSKSDKWFAQNVMRWHLVSNEWRDDNNKYRGSVSFGYYTEEWSPTRNLRDTFEVVHKILSENESIQFILTNKYTKGEKDISLWKAMFIYLNDSTQYGEGIGVSPQDAICHAIATIFYPQRMEKIE